MLTLIHTTARHSMAAMRRAIPITQVSKHIHYNRYDHRRIYKDLHRYYGNLSNRTRTDSQALERKPL